MRSWLWHTLLSVLAACLGLTWVHRSVRISDRGWRQSATQTGRSHSNRHIRCAQRVRQWAARSPYASRTTTNRWDVGLLDRSLPALGADLAIARGRTGA